MAQLNVKNVNMSYEGKQVLNDISFALAGGEYLSIIGENGTGKSTLIKGLLGLKSIDDGAIEFSSDVNPSDIGYLPQSTEVQRNFPATTYEIVLSGRLNRKRFLSLYNKVDKNCTEKIMKKLDILHLKNAPFSSLSGGQQQRVLLARALNSATKILVLDEPTASLDAKASAELYEILRLLNRNEGLTIIMVSHDIEAASRFSSHILYIKSKQLFFGSAEDFFKKGFSGFSGGAEID